MENPSVIVGMACRVPGASTPNKLWDNIIQKKDLWQEMPKDRFNIDAFYHPESSHNGTINTKGGYFLDQPLGHFDNEFFGISGKEAVAMDPQQRILLEVVYEALEDAGIPLESVRGSSTAVYCGTFANANDYNSLCSKDLEHYPTYSITGTGNPIISNRISYFYGFQGPSMTIDTACSSALVGLHLGSQSLQNGEAAMSVVVGSALQFAPNVYQTLSDIGFLSPDSRCRSFDADCSGYVRGDGICAIVLKPENNALHCGDRIRAIVRGTATNHDGKTDGITLPSSEAQEALIRSVYSKAGLNPDHTQFFETHGTGTKAGDPGETRAIGSVFATKSRETPLYIGSIKSNIGHLEGASGLAGLIKTVLAMENSTIPPNMLFKKPNPDILFKGWKIEVPTIEIPWNKKNDIPRRASISSFGYGGSNAHAILEAYDKPAKQSSPKPPQELAWKNNRPYLVPISSHTEDAGKLAVEALKGYLHQKTDLEAESLAYSLGSKRSMHMWRSFTIGHDRASILHDLQNQRATATWNAASKGVRRVGFVFTGQGAQYYNMGRQLIQKSPLFRDVLDKCDKVLQSLPDGPSWSIIKELLRDEGTSNLGKSRFSQPICTAIQLALVCLLRQWAVVPTAVCGHSSGEIAAAYAAGILSVDAAIVVAYYRGLHMNAGARQPGIGAMIAVGMDRDEAAAELRNFQGRLTLAAINSPSSVTISGDKDAICDFHASLKQHGVFARLLKVEQAFHSHHMLPLAAEYKQSLENCPSFTTQKATCRMFSSVTARDSEAQPMDASYWVHNMIRPVKFADSLIGITLNEDEEQNVDILLEIGPHPALKGPSREVLSALKVKIPYIGTLNRDIPAHESLLEAAGQLFTSGYSINLDAVNRHHRIIEDSIVQGPHAQRLYDLPPYSWNHKNYWFATRLVDEYLHRPWRHMLLGAPVPGSTKNMPRFRNYIRLSEIPWLKDHVIDSKVLFPAAGFICMAVEAGARLHSDRRIKKIKLRDLLITSAMTPKEDNDEGCEVLTELYPVTLSSRTRSDDSYEFSISSYDETNEYKNHCRGRISLEYGTPEPLTPNPNYPEPAELYATSDRRTNPSKLYASLSELNMHYGPRFALLKDEIHTGPGFAISQIQFDPSYLTNHELSERTIMHPTFLDASMHAMFPVIEGLLGRQMTTGYVDTSIGSIDISGVFASKAGSSAPQQYTISTFTKLPSPRVAISDILIYQPDGQPMIELHGIEATEVQTDSPRSKDRTLFFRQRWQPCFEFHERNDREELPRLLRTYSFQYPTSKVLCITSQAEHVKDLIPHIWFSGTQRPRFGKLHIWTNNGADDFDSIFDGYPRDLITVCEPEDGYHLIIDLSSSINLSQDDLEALLCPGGFLICTHASKCDAYDRWNSCHVSRRQLPVMNAINLAILMPSSDSVSPRTKGIIQQIRDSQATSTVTVVDPILLPREELPASTIVVLASLDEDIKISDERWIGIRDLLNREDITVIWLLQGATNECSSPDQAAILGMLRAIRSENQQSRFITLDVEVSSSEKHISKRILQVSDPNNTEEEFADRSGCLYIPRVEEDVKLNRKLPNGIGNEPKIQRFGDYRALTLKIGHVGVLESLHFVENDELANNPRKEDEVDVKVMASAINFHDIAVAMGIIQDHTMNGEFAGIVLSVGDKIHISELQPGDRVVGFSPGRCAHGSLVRTKGTFCYKIPDSVGFTIAASLPVILSTAMYCLVEIAHLQPGETVLIHAAAGGVGQMAVQIAQNIGARVLATCSEQKRDFLRQYGLLDSQIFSSRDESFVQGVFRETDGQGVDVVLNSLAGALLQASWGCIKTFGRFVEIGKRDIHQNSHLGMYNFRKNATFTAFDMVTVFEERPKAGHKMLSDGLGLFLRGEVSPPKALHVFPYSQVEKAFRTLQLGKQPGKVIIVPDENDNVLVKPSTYCQTKPLFSPFKVYLLVGGLGGLGIILSEWMHLRGARRFAFLSRSGDKEPDAKDAVKWLREKNSEITVFNGDVGLLSDVESVVTAIGASLAGIFHLAVNFEDSMVRTLSLKQLRHALHAKCEGAMNLHVATKSAKLELDFFVCVSSGASVWGNRGQASYSAANAWLDAFSRWRREQGLPATTMNPGAITTRGQVVKSEIARQSLERNKLDRITEQELTYQAEEAVTLGFPKGDPKGLDWHQLIIGINVADPDVYWSTRSLFRGLYANRKYGDSSAGKGPKNLAKLLQSASTAEERITIAVKAFVAKVASVLGTQLESITSSNALSFYGLDSIVAVEFRRWFKNVCHVDVSLFDVLAPQSIHDLVAKVVTAMPKATVSQSNAVHADDIANRSKEIMSTQYPATFRLPKSQNTSAPLSAFQAPLASMLEKNGDNALSNLVASFRLRGSVSFEMLETSLRMVVDRHSSLKTAFCHIDRSFYQEILPTGGFLVRNYDISSNNYSTSEINNFIFEKASEPLHIANGELGLALLVKLQDNTHLLAIIVHPICFDRASLSVFLDDWTKLYDTIISGGDPTSVAYPRVTYVDFTVAQKEHLHSSESLCHLHYWSSSLKNLPKPSRLLQFAHESQPVSMLNRKGSEHKLRFNAKLLSRLRRITSLLNATPFHFLVAAFRAYMYWQTSDSDIAILKVVDDRPHPSTEHMVGNFMNFIPIRLQVDDDMVFEDLVLHARDITRQGEIHSDVPFDGIVTALGLESTDNCMPVSQLGIRYRANTAASVYSTCDFVATAEKPMNMPSIFDLSLDVEESENDLALSFGYSKELYRADHMELFSHTFHGFLSSLIRDHRQPVKTTSAPN